MGRFDHADDPVVINGKPRCKFPFLTSYAYLRKWPASFIERLLNDDRREILLDSGAFTAFNSGSEIDLAEYMAFLHKWKDRLFGYMLLDKLQDPVTTEQNWHTMLASGLSPIPIHVFGEGQARMDEFFQHSDWVACGGLRRPHRGPAPPEYVKQKMEWAAGRPVHWLGYTKDTMIRAFRPFSVDCASAFSSMLYGQISIYFGNWEWWVGTFPEWKKANPLLRKRIRSTVLQYGIDPTGLDDPLYWRWLNRNVVESSVQWPLGIWTQADIARHSTANYIAHISVRAWVRYSYEVRRNFGTRVFLATEPKDEHIVDAAIEWASIAGWDAPLVIP